jgi:hypothetical protein
MCSGYSWRASHCGPSGRSGTFSPSARRPSADVEVVDVLSEPERAEADRIMATPTVLRLSPDPVCRVIGDLSDFALAGAALGLTFAPRAVHGNDEEPDD